MPLQDLTPQLRTRLHRVERIVTFFVVLATLLLLVGFGYYLYNTAARKGWFIPKCRYFTLLMSAEGLKVGDPVVLMGFNVGEIVQVDAQPPDSYYKIFVSFDVRRPYYGYVWSDSKLHINSSLLGGRHLELMPGYNGKPTVEPGTDRPVRVLVKGEMVPLAKAPKGIYVEAAEDISVGDRAQKLIAQVEGALPGIFAVTNKVNAVLANVVNVTSNLNEVLLDVRPVLTNAQVITANLRDPHGSLGNWLIPTNLNLRLDTALASANGAATNLNNHLTLTTANLNRVLLNVSAITSNLNTQIQSNDQLLGNVNNLLLETEDMMRGLKRHWLLKGAFPAPKLDSPPLLLEPQIQRGQP